MDCECLSNARNMTILSTVAANMLAEGLSTFEINILSNLLASIGAQLDLLAAFECDNDGENAPPPLNIK